MILPSRGERGDRASVTVFVLLIAVALTALLALVAEGGMVLDARQTAMAEAEQAARAAAAELSEENAHLGLVIDNERDDTPVMTAIYLMAAAGHPGTAIQHGRTVTATVTPYRVATPLLTLVGYPFFVVSASASASAITG